MAGILHYSWLLPCLLQPASTLKAPRGARPAPTASTSLAATDWKQDILTQERCRFLDSTDHDAAIVYLVPSPDPSGYLCPTRAGADWNFTLNSLRSLANFGDQRRAEVRIFIDEEDNFTADNIEELLDAATSSARDACVMRIKFRTFPDGFDPDGNKSPSAVRSKWGYEHMISFFFSGLFMSDALDSVDYWMRMDTDSYFREPVQVDPFAILEKLNISYLHNDENKDHGEVTEGLCDFVRHYAKSHSLPHAPACDNGDQFVRGFYNNIEVGRVSDFQTPAVIEFMQATQASQGIFLHRWGDALLRRILIEMLEIGTRQLPEALLENYHHGTE